MKHEPLKKDNYSSGKIRREKSKYENTYRKEEIDPNILFGRNAVMEALKADRTIDKLLIQKGEGEGSIIKIARLAKEKGILIQETEKAKLDEITGMQKHQGVVAYVAMQNYVEIEEILDEAKEKGEDPLILILENIQDPHNLGAIIRTAHNAGVHGIIIPKRRAVGLTAVVAKASAGAIEYMKIAKVSNIAQTIKKLQQNGLWVVCADMDGETMYQKDLKGPLAIVIGSEGEGVTQLTKERSDFVVSIPMYGKVTSLNASVAASLLVYEVVRQRNFI